MNATIENTRCAVRLPSDEAGAHSLDRYLAENGLSDAIRFSSSDDEQMYAEICAGHYDRIVFANLDALLAALWKNEIDLDQWIESGIHVELANPGAGEPVDWLEILQTLHNSTKQWRQRHRRRQVIASLVLSIVALIAMVILFYFVPPAQ